MGDLTKIGIDKLNNDNYQVWKYKLELYLMKEELWEIVKEDKPSTVTTAWNKKDSKAKAIIGLLVEDNQLIHVRHTLSSKEAWESLRKYHEKSTLTNKVFLFKRLCNEKYEESKPMEEHIHGMMMIIDKLTSLGENIPDHLTIAFILCSLPKSYDNLITALESRPEKDLTIEIVKEKIISEYNRRESTNKERDTESNVLKVEHRQEKEITTRNERKNMNQIDRESDSEGEINREVCYYCNKPGHYKRECRKLAYDNRSRKYKYNQKGKHSVQKVALGEPNHREDKTCSKSKNKNCIDSNSREICFTIGKELMPNCWYIDSGASCHMCNDRKFFEIMNKSNNDIVKIANGLQLQIKGEGHGTLVIKGENDEKITIRISNVLYVPELTSNLLSVSEMTRRGIKIVFENNMCTITKDDVTIKAKKIQQLYVLEDGETALVSKVERKEQCIHTWHRRFGHRNYESLRKICNKSLVEGMKISTCEHEDFCKCCIMGKISRKPFPKSSCIKTNDILELIHTDLCGPMNTITPGGKRYIMTIIDDFSRYCKIYLLGHKYEAKDKLLDYIALVENQHGKAPKMIRSDRGGEFTNKAIKNILAKKGIKQQTTTPYTPEQNGIAERKNRSLCEMVLTMLNDSNLPNKYWGEAVMTANYIQNRLNTKLCNKTPYETWKGKTPNVQHLRVFGETCFAQIPKEMRSKLDVKAKELIFVGYAEGTKGYRLLDKDTDRITISRDTVFMNEENAHQPRRSERKNKGVGPERLGYTAEIQEIQEPKTVTEALNGDQKKQWKEAMEEEIESLKLNGTWTLEEPTIDKNVIGCKWTFKLKRDALGKINRFKCRVVALGYSQKYGHDYDQIFAPVVRHSTIRILLSVAGRNQMHVKHVDVKTAFLHGDLNENIYMRQPEGFEKIGKENWVCKLHKSIYGLKQSARAWNEKLNQILIGFDFKRSIYDPCLYIKGTGENLTYLAIYVDDIIIASSTKTLLNETTEALRSNFTITDMGEIKHYLGLQIERNHDGSFEIHQRTYIKSLIDKFNLSDAKASNIPLEVSYAKVRNDRETLQDNKLYREAVGAILFIAVNTRPDISTAISILSQKVSSPTQEDWNEIKRVLRYLKGTISERLILGKKGAHEKEGLVAYADADWAGNVETRRSNSGYVFKLNGDTIDWSCKTQSCVALSSTEAEYVSLCETAKHAQWLRNLLEEMQLPQILATVIYEDNQGCIKLLEKETINARTKHIDVRYHYTRALKESNIINVIYCPTETMIADGMTKPLNGTGMKRFRFDLGLIEGV